MVRAGPNRDIHEQAKCDAGWVACVHGWLVYMGGCEAVALEHDVLGEQESKRPDPCRIATQSFRRNSLHTAHWDREFMSCPCCLQRSGRGLAESWQRAFSADSAKVAFFRVPQKFTSAQNRVKQPVLQILQLAG